MFVKYCLKKEKSESNFKHFQVDIDNSIFPFIFSFRWLLSTKESKKRI